jgi:hypothetical protein
MGLGLGLFLTALSHMGGEISFADAWRRAESPLTCAGTPAPRYLSMALTDPNATFLVVDDDGSSAAY